ncbi:MAG: inositol 2-dehydrogenase [Chloroflexi bacterium]|nr:inositol 2-dehydrogenase [Chloroflexota bacterium]
MGLKVGVIGAGRIGKLHAENLVYRVPEAEALVIADVNKAAAEECAQRLRIPTATSRYQDILENSAIEAVLICSSTDTHSQIIEEAAAAGKHIFCEKPIDYDLKRIDGALKAVEKAGVKLQIGFNRRFDPNFRHVQEMVAAGKIGEPAILRITSRDPAPPPIAYVKVSGGMFLDMTIHDFDMARFLIGSEVVEVYAVGGVTVDPAIGQAGDVDTAVITLKFANGVIGTIDNCRRAVYGYDQRIEVFGSAGNLVAANNTPHNVTYSNGDAVLTAKPLYFFLERYTESFVEEMRQFIASVTQNKPTPVTGRDGLIPVMIGLAAQKSLREGRPVKLSEIG